MSAEFRLLGDVEVWIDGQRVDVGHARQRCVLVALLVDAGQVVSVDQLVGRVWGDHPGPSNRDALYSYLSRLRRSMAAAHEVRIERRPGGYVISADPASIDLHRFRHGVARARAALDDGEALDAYESALDQWRGDAFGTLDSGWLANVRAGLAAERLAAELDRNDVALRLGKHAGLVVRLAELAASHPLDERVAGQLALSLHRSGRAADALAMIQRTKRRLAEELGVDPCAELREVELAILRREPVDGASGPTPTSRPLAAPAQLPPMAADFTGRAAEVTALTAALSNGRDAGCIHVVSGKGGVGKSTLAAQVAHLVADHYPDGVLYAELRGMSDTPAKSKEVLGRFLGALGVASTALPETVEERAEVFRTLVAGRRMLVVLDDAATERQVRPLLPGGSGCGVVITSRARLTGLAGARLLDLDVMDSDESTAFLSKVVGADRACAEQEAVERIAAVCHGLPLALRIAGARLASRQGWPLRLLADRLADERRRLDELAVGDQEVRVSISLSYRNLDPQARSALGWLGFLGLPSFPAWILAMCLDVPVPEGDRVVERLVDAQLVDFVRVDGVGHLRYRLHDLVRLYARERAEAERSSPARRAVLVRVLGSWLWLAQAVSAGSPPGEFPVRDRPAGTCRPRDGVAERVLAEPRAWFDAEHGSLITAVELAAAAGLHQLACDLAAVLSTAEYTVTNQFDAWARTHGIGLQAARRGGNRYGEATMLAGLGQLRLAQDRYDQSRFLFCQALGAFRECGNRRGEAATLAALGAIYREQGLLDESLRLLGEAAALIEPDDGSAMGYVKRLAGAVRLEQGDYPGAYHDLHEALQAHQRAGSRRGEALTQRTMALYHRARGEFTESVDLCHKALAGFKEIGDTLLEAYGLRALGKALIRLGRSAEALPRLKLSLRTSHKAGDRWGQAATLRVLGELHLAQGELTEADRLLNAAIRRWDELSLPLHRARTLRDIARLHQAHGHHDTAANVRTEALAIFKRYGAREYAEVTLEAQVMDCGGFRRPVGLRTCRPG